MKAILALIDGTVFEGTAIGSPGTTIGQVVFSTGMTGYQEMLTDPSFGGQILTFTYPLIGNYGVTSHDAESERVHVAGVVLKELASFPSNWRSDMPLEAYLEKAGVTGIAGVDTRALTRRIRMGGVMMGAISTEMTASELLEHVRRAPDYGVIDFVREVTTKKPFVWQSPEDRQAPRTGPTDTDSRRHRIAVIDLGVKYNILRRLSDLGCEVHVLPADTTADEVLDLDPTGILVSPGPGDPRLLGYTQKTLDNLVDKKPILGICLGHQLLAHSFGGSTFRLKFGHRGGNHPVKDLQTGAVTITSQNHGFAVDPTGLEKSGTVVARVNLNDGTVEGLRHVELPIFSLQYHPEASPGPWDSDPLFMEFLERLDD